LNRDVREILERRKAECGNCLWVFSNTKGTRPIGETTVRKILHRVAKRAGILYGRGHEDGFIFHDARHTAATNMLERGSHIKTVGAILGHTDETMTMRYSHATSEARAGAVASLARRMSNGAGNDFSKESEANGSEAR
jgi:integrase